VNKVKVRIVTPQREMYDGEADMVILRSQNGDIGVMHGHTPLMTVLDYGILRLMENGETVKKAAVFGGFAEINKEGVNILTDTAEWSDEIDVARAEEAKARAEKKLLENVPDLEEVKFEMDLKRAIIRIRAAEDK